MPALSLLTRWRGIYSQQALPVSLIFPPLHWLRVRVLLTPLPLFDFMSYWVAGRFFLADANPYDPAQCGRSRTPCDGPGNLWFLWVLETTSFVML
jgi:hypothetical protein